MGSTDSDGAFRFETLETIGAPPADPQTRRSRVAPKLSVDTVMITQAVLSSRAAHLTLFKKDSPRPIDRVIDYFGDGRPSETTTSRSSWAATWAGPSRSCPASPGRNGSS